MTPKTLYEKLFDEHVVSEMADGTVVVYIDRHLVEDHASANAFAGLRASGSCVRSPERTLAVVDHNAPLRDWSDQQSHAQIATLLANAQSFGIACYGIGDARQGITHVVGAEQGFILPGSTIACGDSHTATNGALGALAFAVGTSDVEHILRTQSLVTRRQKTMRITITGTLPRGVEAKDLMLALIGQLGTSGATGHAIEFDGPGIDALSVEARMTVCNMAVELGAVVGLIAPDEKTFAYLQGRPRAPEGDAWQQALAYWKTLRSDTGATFARQHTVACVGIKPMVTWGTSPDQVVAIDGRVPDLDALNDGQRAHGRQARAYMGLAPGAPIAGLPIDVVWIGSCTNGRIEDLRRAAHILQGRRISPRIDRALVVPGSGWVKRQAEDEGLRDIFESAGFQWSEPGCSMCLGMNGDVGRTGQRCASTSNRNFEHRQGHGVRTHLVSPSMAAAAAVAGCLIDVRDLL